MPVRTPSEGRRKDCPLKEVEEGQTQLAASQRREKAAVEFINWVHSEFGRYMPAVYYDKFDKWRGPQEAGADINVVVKAEESNE